MYREGQRHTAGPLIVRYRRNELGHPRFGLAVGRRVGNAVTRNRVKRWLREAARHEREDLEGFDIVFIARPSAAGAGHAGIRSAVASALSRIRAGGER